MAEHRKYTVDQVKDIVVSCRSIRQVLIKLKLATRGGNYKTIYNFIMKNEIDISHFSRNGWRKGDHTPKRNIYDYLSNKFPIHSHGLRLRLIKEGYKEHRCESCNNTEWLCEPIPLELDHIDGNNQNNNLSNLRILCPNCHAKTDTYRGKNKK